MKLLFALVLSAAAMAQNASITVISTGDIARNSVAVLNTNFANLNTAKVARFTGTGAPGSIPLNLPGDIYSDTTNGNLYWCAAPTGTLAPACTSVTTGGWTKANGGSPPAGCTTAVQRNGGGVLAGDCNFTYNGTTVSSLVPVSVVATGSGGGVGTSTSTHNWTGVGPTMTLIDPNALSSSGRAEVFGAQSYTYMSGYNAPSNYANSRGSNSYFEAFSGHNFLDNSNKNTIYDTTKWVTHRGSGQRGGQSWNITCPALGDCVGVDVNIQAGGHAFANGDEQAVAYRSAIWLPDQTSGTLQSPPVTSTTCNTTSTGSISQSSDATAPSTWNVSSTTGCTVGDLVSLDAGAWGVADANEEVVRLTGVGAGTLSALVAHSHSTSTPVQPAVYVSSTNQDLGTVTPYNDPGSFGQDRLVVLNPASPVTTAGTITSVCGDATAASCAFVGSGTSWAGLGAIGYCISPDVDQIPFNSGSNRRFYWPINSVTDNTHITVYRYNGQATGPGATFQVVACGRIGLLDLTASSAGLQVQGMALYANPITWTVGGTLLQPIDQWAGISHQVLAFSHFDGPQGYHSASTSPLGTQFRAVNDGESTMGQAFLADIGKNGVNATGWGDYDIAFRSRGWTQFATVSLEGKNLATGFSTAFAGKAVVRTTYSGDEKCDEWSGTGHDTSHICAGTTGNGMIIEPGSAKLRLWDGGANHSLTLAFPSLLGDRTATFPDNSGVVALSNPSTISVALPDTAGGAIELGYYPYGSTGYTRDMTIRLSVALIGGGFDFRAKSYLFTTRTDLTTADIWYGVAPFPDTGPSTAIDYRVDADNDSSGNFRIRLVRTNTSTPTGVTAWVTLNAEGTGPLPAFVITGTTSTPSAPTAWWPTAVVGQTANKMTITNATGFAATLDPTALTAARTITLPNWAGTPDYDGGTTFGISGCSATSPTGAATVGTYTSGTSGTCAVTVTMGDSRSAAHGWGCSVYDMTTPADVQGITATNATTVTFSGTTVSGDVVQFSCRPY